MAAVVAVFAFAPVSPGLSQGWSVSASVDTGAEFDDNPLLRRNGGEATFSASVSPDITIDRAFQTGNFRLGLGLTAEKFSGDGVEGPGGQDLDTVDFRVNTGFNSIGQRIDFGVGASYVNQTARTSELTDTGILDASARRRAASGNGRLSYTLTELNFLDLNASIQDVNYDSGLFSDYRSYSGNLGFRRTLSSVNEAGVKLGYSRFDPRSADDTESDTFSVSLTWNYRPLESFSIKSSAGVRIVDSRPSAGSTGSNETNTGATFSLGLDWAPTPRDSVAVNASNGIEPSGSGSVQNQWALSASYGRDLTSDIKFSFPVSFQFQQAVDDPSTEDRIYFDIGPNLAWMFLPNWRLSATYRFRGQDNAGGGSFARSNAVMLRVAYQRSML